MVTGATLDDVTPLRRRHTYAAATPLRLRRHNIY